MHTLRLLDQAIEIADHGKIIFPRPNKQWLKKVKTGEYAYEEILSIADEKNAEMESAFEKTSLPEKPCDQTVQEVLLEIRSQFGHHSPQ